MSNHIHAILSTPENELSGVVRDFKGFTSKAIVKAIHDENESRREWMLQRFVASATRTARNENYKVWTHDNHPLQMRPHFIMQRVIPVRNTVPSKDAPLFFRRTIRRGSGVA